MNETPTRFSNLAAHVYVGLCLAGLSSVTAISLWRPLATALGEPTDDLALQVSALAAVLGLLVSVLSPALSRRVGKSRFRLLALCFAGVIGLTIASWGGMVSFGVVALVVSLCSPPMLSTISQPMANWYQRYPTWATVFLLATLGAGVGSIRMSAYMGDPDLLEFATPPGNLRMQRHFCATAYLHAAHLVELGVDNVYDLALVPANNELPETAANMAPFDLDRFGYPPQFLLLPLAVVKLAPDFLAQRALWFGLNALLFAFALWRTAVWIGPRYGLPAFISAPLLWSLGGMTFQIGNVHLVVIAVAVLAMIAFAEKRERTGGLLLAIATLSKIAPGLLGVVLLVQRRYWAAAWTFIFAILLSAIAWLVLGQGPFQAFIEYHLPRVASGEAYDFLDDAPREIFTNVSAFGLPFKLHALNLMESPWAIAPYFGKVFTALAFLLTIVASLKIRRDLDDTPVTSHSDSLKRKQLLVWLVVLTLGALRSPMAPPYVMGSVFWAMGFLTVGRRTLGSWTRWVLAWLPLMIEFPPVGITSLWASLFACAWLYGLLIWMALRKEAIYLA